MNLIKFQNSNTIYVVQMLKGIVRIILIMGVFVNSVSSSKKSRQVEPSFLPTPTNVTVHKGELAVLKCHILNLGPKSVQWRQASKEHPLTIGETTFTPSVEFSVVKSKISDNESKWNLLIKNVQPKHAGVYECQISAMLIHTHYVALNVLNEPLERKRQLKVSGTEYVNQYRDIHLKCNATGISRAPDDVDWFFNGNRIHTSHPRWYGRIEILKHRPVPGVSYISELIIHLSTMEDQGNYVCRSSDLNVNSMKVHILNNYINPKKPRSQNVPGEERTSEDMRRRARNGARRTLESSLRLITILAFILIYR